MAPRRPQYSPVVGGDEPNDIRDDSSTDVDRESLADLHSPTDRHKKSWQADEFGHARTRRRQSRWRTCCSSAVLQRLVNTVLLVLVLGLLLDRRWQMARRYGQFEGNGDITGFVPPVSQQIRTFTPDTAFSPENSSDFLTDAVREKWLSIVPKGLGYLHVEHPSDYNNLPHPLKGHMYEKVGPVYTTSVTHQLHCLYNIMEVYSSLESGQPIEEQMQGHLPHCFDYLRQSIMCCGDTAVEGQHTTFPHGILGSDGWDAKHVCKNYEHVKDLLEERRANDRVWI